MSILKAIQDTERAYLKEIAYWKGEADYWEKRYWKETLATIQHNNEMFGIVVKAALEGALQGGKASPNPDSGLPAVGQEHVEPGNGPAGRQP